MRIENRYIKSLKAQESLNVSLNTAKGAEFAMMLSLMEAVLYTPQEGEDGALLEADDQMRQLAFLLNVQMGWAFYDGNIGYFCWLRALSEEFPMLQNLTAMRTAGSATPSSVASAYAANAKPDIPTMVQQINQVRTWV